ncbi:MAG: glycosyltransferase family 39 protein [Phycisphaerae bacterium]
MARRKSKTELRKNRATRPAASDRSARAKIPRPLFTAPAVRLHWMHAVLLLFILGIGVVLQWPGLGNEMLERVHGWRQAQTAMTSRNFVRDGMNPFVARVDYIGNGQMQLELPVYQYLVAVCYRVFGINEVWGRIVALLFGMCSAAVLFLIGRLVWNARTGLLAAAVFSWSPLNVYFNRAFMPDSATIFFTLLAFWAFLRFFRDHRAAHLIVASLSIALALAGKPPIAVTVAPPLAVALFLAHGRRFWRQGRLAVGLLAAVVVFAGWMQYSSYVNNNRSDDLGISFTNAGEFNEDLMKWYFGDDEQRGDPRTYRRIFRRTHDWFGHWIPALAATAKTNGGVKAAAESIGR